MHWVFSRNITLLTYGWRRGLRLGGKGGVSGVSLSDSDSSTTTSCVSGGGRCCCRWFSFSLAQSVPELTECCILRSWRFMASR